MELNLQRPLLFFDIESTGLNIATDCICELSFVKVMPGGETRIKTWRFKPWDYALGSSLSAMTSNGKSKKTIVPLARMMARLDGETGSPPPVAMINPSSCVTMRSSNFVSCSRKVFSPCEAK